MNRAAESPPEAAGRIRLDPEPPDGPPIQPPIQPPIEVNETDSPPEASAADDLEEAAKGLTAEGAQDARRAAEDKKFMKEYGEIDLMRLITDGTVNHETEIFKGFTVVIRTLTEDEDQEILKKIYDAGDIYFQMPFLTGLELCEQLKQHEQTRATPALMLTARGFSLPTELLDRTNITDVISKPFSPREILAKVHELIGQGVTQTVDEDS